MDLLRKQVRSDDNIIFERIGGAITAGIRVDRALAVASGYEKPVIKKVKKMSFPNDIIKASGKGVVCRQCSGCHGCR